MRNLTFWNDNRSLTPWVGIIDIEQDLDALVDQTLGGDRKQPEKAAPVSHPACEMGETASHYLLTVDLPGVSKKDIVIELKDNQILITGERKSPRFASRMAGKFYRAVMLPRGVNVDTIEAEYQDGVLSIALPKAETAKKRQIKISEGKTSFFGKLLGGNEEAPADQRAVAESSAH